jgi:hypothetical protein
MMRRLEEKIQSPPACAAGNNALHVKVDSTNGLLRKYSTSGVMSQGDGCGDDHMMHF